MIGPAFGAFFCTLISFLYAQTGRAFLHPNAVPDALISVVLFCPFFCTLMSNVQPLTRDSPSNEIPCREIVD